MTASPVSVARSGRRRLSKLQLGLAIVTTFMLVAISAPILAPYDPLGQEPANRLADPSWSHPLGTDELGRDVLSRLIFAARIDLPVGLLAALLPAIVGTLVGVTATYRGGWPDGVVMRISDVVQAFPSYILVIVLVAALGQGVSSILVSFTVLGWVVYARLIRTEVLRVRETGYVQAARLAGISSTRIVARHVLPNSVSQTIVYLPSDVVFATLALAAFSFLGLGIPPPTAEWGSMIADGQTYIRDQWWLATVPGLVIVVYGLGLSLIADALEERR